MIEVVFFEAESDRCAEYTVVEWNTIPGSTSRTGRVLWRTNDLMLGRLQAEKFIENLNV